MKNETDKIIEIFSGTVWECDMVKMLLLTEGIECFLRNYVGTSYGFNPMIAESVKVMIFSADQERASVIVDQYLKSQ